VDAVSRAEFWDMLTKLRMHNITILVSTPYMDEAMRCDRVALIQNGKMLAIDTPMKIRDGFSRKLFSIKALEKYKLINALRKLPSVITSYPFGEAVHTTFRDDIIPSGLIEYLNNNGISEALISETKAGIEDRFLELMETERVKGRKGEGGERVI
jgi:ABC-type multidrug transport system ATPase subunit